MKLLTMMVIESWEDQKEILRQEFRLFWGSNEMQFKMWWLLSGDDVRRAMVMTALEDQPEDAIDTSMSAFRGTLCPDISDLEALLADGGKKTVYLMEKANNSEENDPDVLKNKDEMMATFKGIFLLKINK
eukprot:TRINITY_DN8118_c0_g1_i2.p1 TRINITY_DN8118_c0_g1~~TRINITY_DN8118_c0_g1_i2.p1  ORF type:complete len:130 (-),score=38.06 TRINITY_DN8118_c0_g1_i2:261-650(-)